jgi:hypothetical protein
MEFTGAENQARVGGFGVGLLRLILQEACGLKTPARRYSAAVPMIWPRPGFRGWHFASHRGALRLCGG